MIAARTADGDAPVISAKNMTTGMPISAVNLELPPQKNETMDSSMATCIPDTATAWLSPAMERLFWVISDSSDRSPVRSARSKPAASPV